MKVILLKCYWENRKKGQEEIKGKEETLEKGVKYVQS